MAFTPDFRPLIGPLPGYPNILIAAGFSGNWPPSGMYCRTDAAGNHPARSTEPFL